VLNLFIFPSSLFSSPNFILIGLSVLWLACSMSAPVKSFALPRHGGHSGPRGLFFPLHDRCALSEGDFPSCLLYFCGNDRWQWWSFPSLFIKLNSGFDHAMFFAFLLSSGPESFICTYDHACRARRARSLCPWSDCFLSSDHGRQ
jgi:hypothetical protein